MNVDRRHFCRTALMTLASRPAFSADFFSNETVVHPREYEGALRNPLKGLRSAAPLIPGRLPYASIAKAYVQWNKIENQANDGAERIREFCNAQWSDLRLTNTKVVPRVYLEWPGRGRYWPSDLTAGDYSSPEFKRRMVRMIEKLGEAWDDDPRVAFVETGLIGLWGEQHDPEPSLELQKLIGDAYTASFRKKLLMNRYPGHFTNYNFGIYWDSFGHKEEAVSHVPLLHFPRLESRWKSAPMGGETAFDWGTPFGKNPTDALVRNGNAILALIQDLHWNHLGWLSDYDQKNNIAVANAERIQKALGYRFIVEEVRFTSRIEPGASFQISMGVRNIGSSPFYYRWPVEVSLLDPESREPRWKAEFPEMDVTKILPEEPARQIAGRFSPPASLAKKNYIVAVAILDPASGKPAARFAVANYFRGGRHPIGWIGIGAVPNESPLPAFDDPAQDHSLRY